MTKVSHQPSVEAAQLVRIREVWLTAQPRPDEIRRAYRRWSSPVVKKTRRGLRASWLLAVATLLFGGGALAITRAFAFHLGTPTASPSIAASRSLPREQLDEKRRPSPQTIQTPAAIGAHSAERASKLRVPSTGSTSSSPGRTITQSSAGVPPAEPVAAPIASTTTSASFPVIAAESGSWSRVAAAMREGDTQRVNAALELLRGSEDAATRDAARLTQAQLGIANGHTEPARTELRNLAESGATPLVRHRARALLREISK